MSNKEKYKQAFSQIKIDKEILLEEKNISTKNKLNFKKIVASILGCFLIGLVAQSAYAANIGGIKNILNQYRHGQQFEMDIEIYDNGSYEIKYIDENGQVKEEGGAKVVFDFWGNARPATKEEILESIKDRQLEILYDEDGKMMIYYYDQKIDITDKFENNVCYIKLSNEDEDLYVTIKLEDTKEIIDGDTPFSTITSPDGFEEIE